MISPRWVVRSATLFATFAACVAAPSALAIDPGYAPQPSTRSSSAPIGYTPGAPADTFRPSENWSNANWNTPDNLGQNWANPQQGLGQQPGQLMPPVAGFNQPMFDGRGRIPVQPISRNVPPSGPSREIAGRAGEPMDNAYHPLLNPSGETPIATAQPNRWRLGVFTQDTETGCVIAKVTPGSPAREIHLEPRDRIVAVNGYRVGQVHGARYDLGNEFNLRADQDGLVHLLVQDNRTGTLTNVSVNLEPRLSQVSGTLTWNSASRLPNDAYAQIQLQEVFRRGAPPIVVAEREEVNLRGSEVPFVIEFDPSDIDQTRQYIVAATITNGHYTYFQHTQPVSVITQGQPRRVDVAMRQIYDWTGRQQYTEADEFAEFERMWRKYMGRPLRQSELALYRSQFSRGAAETNSAAVDMLSSPEFYNSRCNADDRNFITNVYRLRTNREPNEQEIQYWLAKLQEAEGFRRPLTRELVSTLN